MQINYVGFSFSLSHFVATAIVLAPELMCFQPIFTRVFAAYSFHSAFFCFHTSLHSTRIRVANSTAPQLHWPGHIWEHTIFLRSRDYVRMHQVGAINFTSFR